MEYLTFQLEVLGRDAEQFGETAMEMEGAEMHMLGNFAERGAAAIVFGHEEHGGDEAGEFRVGGEVGGADGNPIAERRHEAIKDNGAGAERGIRTVGDGAEDPVLAAGIGNGDAIGGNRLAAEVRDALANILR